MSAYAVVRVRAKPGGIKPDIRETMRLLRLTRVNHCTIVSDEPSVRGMVAKVKDYVTWGEIEPATLEELLATRARLEGDKPLTDAHLAEHTAFKTLAAFAKALVDGKAGLNDVPGLKGVLRLSPPKRGYEGVKRTFRAGGALGYRGADINELVKRMI